MNRLLILIVVSTSLAHSQSKLISPEIKGAVTDESGAPVAGAIVYAEPQNGFNDAFPISVEADQDGHFDFRGKLSLGSYKLYARTGEADSADPLDSFYADREATAPAIDLAKTHPTATVRLKLSPQVAVVSGRIIDARTGEKLSGYLAYMDGEGQGHGIHVDGDYRILLPPGKDITLMFRLAGPPYLYVVPVAPLRLEPGQYVNLDLPVRH